MLAARSYVLVLGLLDDAVGQQLEERGLQHPRVQLRGRGVASIVRGLRLEVIRACDDRFRIEEERHGAVRSMRPPQRTLRCQHSSRMEQQTTAQAAPFEQCSRALNSVIASGSLIAVARA